MTDLRAPYATHVEDIGCLCAGTDGEFAPTKMIDVGMPAESPILECEKEPGCS